MTRFLLIGLIKVVPLFAFLAPVAATVGLPVNNVWFDISVFNYVFSAFTSGMPEPSQESSFVYVWMFRSFHLLSANGTAYFIHRKRWADIAGKKEEC